MLTPLPSGTPDLYVEPPPSLPRESLLQLGVLSFEIPQMGRHGVRRCTLGAQRGRRPARAGRENTSEPCQLTPRQEAEILSRLKQGERTNQLAIAYNVDRDVIEQLARQ
jgi:hypothetical protein